MALLQLGAAFALGGILWSASGNMMTPTLAKMPMAIVTPMVNRRGQTTTSVDQQEVLGAALGARPLVEANKFSLTDLRGLSFSDSRCNSDGEGF